MLDSHTLTQYRPQAELLRGHIILITGAGDGIGKSAALNFAHYGATIILVGKTLAKLEIVYDAIEAIDNSATPAIFPLNLESAGEHDYTSMLDVLSKEFGHLDGILHNAGELGPRTPIENYSAAAWQKVMQVNVTAPFLMTKALLPLLKKSKHARIVFTGSSVGIKARAYWGAYAVSKAATENLMALLADEFEASDNIVFNSINPGGTRTSMRAAAYPAEDPSTVSHPDELMNRYLFLFSKENNVSSGQQFDAQPKD